jgi:cellobiose phosphorylase
MKALSTIDYPATLPALPSREIARMSSRVSQTVPTGSVTRSEGFVQNRYGCFSADGTEFWIRDPATPRPWVNIIANPRVGLAVSQTGSGFSWIDNSQLAVITRWQQDLACDCAGKFLYVRDVDGGQVWSLSPAPVWPTYDSFQCRHGLGYTVFETVFAGIRASWTLFCHSAQTAELWLVEIQNTTDRLRRLELTAYLEWCCGVAPQTGREFHKLFTETEFDAERRAIFARKHMWEVPSDRFGHWNTDFPYVSALACSEPLLAAQGDKAAFLGQYGDLRAPRALTQDLWKPEFGRHADPVAALRCGLDLRAGEVRRCSFVLATAESRPAVEQLLAQYSNAEALDHALAEVRAAWRARLSTHRIDTPEPSLNYLVNDWVRYQAISGRLWARCGYYQQSGAFGFRDQLQDSQVWLTIDPAQCRAQIRLHAAHQFADGSVVHWWHPLTEQGHVTRMSDNLLWLAFVTASYIRETGQLDILEDTAPFVDERQPRPLWDHILRAFRRAFRRFSPRGLPYIGAGDWNDGLSALGLQERGESIWLAHFLAGLLRDWAEIWRRWDQRIGGPTGWHRHLAGDEATWHGLLASEDVVWDRSTSPAPAAAVQDWLRLAVEFDERRAALIDAINRHGWDGHWYLRATLDDGSPLGSQANRVARIFLNSQTWAILSDVAPPDRAQECMAAVREHLVTEAGALLLAPAFDRPVREIGYITRYAPGLRENGGVYTHAATWALAAACKMKDRELVARLLTAINPALKDPDRYWAEPYVLPGNVDGPDSPHHGRAGWTWYTGSAQWFHRVVAEWVLGVRPEWDGLRIDPCLPPHWTQAHMTRPWRGCTYDIVIERVSTLPADLEIEVSLDGQRLATNVVPAAAHAGGRHQIVARIR